MWPFGHKPKINIIETEVVKSVVIILDDDEFNAVVSFGRDIMLEVREYDPNFGTRHTLTITRKNNVTN